ncbi:MAG: F0F1 ATP synthase subunit A [Acidimicrobiales bacterium]|nr:F0F1 ATP synthase subunit A [Acidimicrobiales bacterium]
MLALEFPPLTHVVRWPAFFGEGEWYAFNKVALVCMIAMALSILLFVLGNKKQMVPTRMQSVAELSVEFIEDGIVKENIGPEYTGWTPVLMGTFFFVLFTNIFEVIPVFQMPASAQIAVPMMLAVFAFFCYVGAGMKAQGPIGYLKSSLFPPGLPVILYVLITPIEFVSTFLVRPFSLMVRLFANLLAGHMLLVTFSTLAAALFVKNFTVIFLPLPAFAMIFFTAFEVLVSVLQAYVFTLLLAVYIGLSVHADH